MRSHIGAGLKQKGAKGLGDGSLGKMFVRQTRGPESKCRTPTKKLSTAAHISNSNPGEAETGGSLKIPGYSIQRVPGSARNPVSRKQGWE